MALRKYLVFETEPYGTKWIVNPETKEVFKESLDNKYELYEFVGVKKPGEDKIYTIEELMKNPRLAENKYFVFYNKITKSQEFQFWEKGDGNERFLEDWHPSIIVKCYVEALGIKEADIEWVEYEIEEEGVSKRALYGEENKEKNEESIKDLKDTLIDIRDTGEVYVWKILKEDEIKKKVQEAIERYKKRTGKKEEKVYKCEFKLPKIITPDGREIDLDALYSGSTLVAELIGFVPYICYIDTKDDLKVKYIHFPESEVLLVADSSDPERIYLVHRLKLTKEGLKG
jgi:hypothetical protein